MVDKWIGKYAVITGASSGIGAAIFKELAKNGINVIGLARRLERVEALIAELGQTKGKAFAYKCDVSDPESVRSTFKRIEKEFGTVHILVNNAGVGRNTLILEESEEAFRKINEIFDTNVRGLLQCTREAYRLMKKADTYGLIININSVVGHSLPNMGVPSWNVYPASKYAVTALSTLIRHELANSDNKKVRITSLSPGYVDTEIVFASGFVDANNQPTSLVGMPALKAEDIAHSAMFLLSTPYTVNISELTVRPTGEKF